MFSVYVTGTDTGIGKTVFAAALAGALGAHYWKPVQAGIEDEGTDAQQGDRNDQPSSSALMALI